MPQSTAHHNSNNNQPTIGIIGLGAIGFMLTNELIKSKKGYCIKLIGKPKSLQQFKNYYTEVPLLFCNNYRQFFSPPYPKLILLAIPNPINNTLKSIAPHITKPIAIVALQNGVQATEVLKKILKPHQNNYVKLVRGCITNASSRNSLQSLKPAKYDPHRLHIGLSTITDNQSLEQAFALFNSTNFNAKKIDSLTSLRWSKLISGNLFGLTSVITLSPLSQILYDNQLLKFETQAFKERLSIMKKHKVKIVNLPGFKAKNIARIFSFFPVPILVRLKSIIKKSNLAPRSHTMPSTAKKILAGKKTEIDFYLKPIIKLAAKYNQPIPNTKKTYRLIKKVESGKINPRKLNFTQRKKLLITA